jgi:hypothetical protein
MREREGEREGGERGREREGERERGRAPVGLEHTPRLHSWSEIRDCPSTEAV